MGCFLPENGQKFLRISSEEKGISSEVIAISSEFIPQRKEKKYISIYISFSIYVVKRTRVCVCIVCAHTHVGMYTQARRQKRKPAKKVSLQVVKR